MKYSVHTKSKQKNDFDAPSANDLALSTFLFTIDTATAPMRCLLEKNCS